MQAPADPDPTPAPPARRSRPRAFPVVTLGVAAVLVLAVRFGGRARTVEAGEVRVFAPVERILLEAPLAGPRGALAGQHAESGRGDATASRVDAGAPTLEAAAQPVDDSAAAAAHE